jgi:hypothetical protein
MTRRSRWALCGIASAAMALVLVTPAGAALVTSSPAEDPAPTICSADAVASPTGPEWSTAGFPDSSALAGDTTVQQRLDAEVARAESLASSHAHLYPDTSVTIAMLEADDPTLTLLSEESGGSQGPTSLSVDTATDGEGIILTALSSSGWCWAVLNNQAEDASARVSGPPPEPWPSCATDPGTWYAAFYVGPPGPPANLPEAPVTVALPVLAAGIGGVAVSWRRRNRTGRGRDAPPPTG